jgi:S1-C subfamily serine protease
MNIHKLKKESRTFMPEILAPGTGLTPPTNKSVLPTNNVHTIQDVMDGRSYKLPGGGGDWSSGEDVSHSYKEEGDAYKREMRDFEIINKMTAPTPDESEKWKVRTPGGTRSFPSFTLVQRYREEMRKKGIPIKWVSRVAQKQDRVQVVSSSLKRTFKVESIDSFNSVKETGSAFCVAPQYFITCAHVVVSYDKSIEAEMDINDYVGRVEVSILSNGHRIPAQIIDLNAAWDIAILKADIDVDPFSLDIASMQVGDDILTIGSPHGFENNTSFGNIGSIGRDIYGNRGSAKYMFIDAPVFQGNSGGPIVKIDNGEVVGMLTAIVAKNGEYGLNVGLPSNYIRNFCIMNNITVN